MIVNLNKHNGKKALVYLAALGVFFCIGSWAFNVPIPAEAKWKIPFFITLLLASIVSVLKCFVMICVHLTLFVDWLRSTPKKEVGWLLHTAPMDREELHALFAKWDAEPQDWFDRVIEFFVDDVWGKITTVYYGTKLGIQNLKYWFPVIWGDREWDECFIYMILLHKLQKIEHYRNTSKGYWPGADDDKINKDLHIMILLIQRILKDDYDHNFGIYGWNFTSQFPRMGPALPPYEYLCFMENQDKDLFFKLLNKRIGRLWD